MIPHISECFKWKFIKTAHTPRQPDGRKTDVVRRKTASVFDFNAIFFAAHEINPNARYFHAEGEFHAHSTRNKSRSDLFYFFKSDGEFVSYALSNAMVPSKVMVSLYLSTENDAASISSFSYPSLIR